MKLRYTTAICILVSTMMISQTLCAASVKFESDARVKTDSSAFELVKAGSALDIKQGTSALAITKTGIPVLIYQPASNSSKLLITDADLEQATTAELQPRLQANTSEIINGLRKSESLIQKKDYEQALQILVNLDKKFPRISSVLFLKGTSHYLLNQKSDAADSLEKGLALEPENAPAQKLLSQLKGSR